MIYAVFYQEPPEDDEFGNCPVASAAFEVLNKELGGGQWAGGQDNGWSVDAVDSKDKLPALAKAHPGREIIELDERNYQLWCLCFGEFSPSGTPEDWYKRAIVP